MTHPQRSGFLASVGIAALALAVQSASASQIDALKAHVPDKVDFDPVKNAGVHKIALLHINAPRKIVVDNSSLMGAAFPGLVELSVESGMNGVHAGDYIKAMQAKSISFVPGLAEALTKALQDDGYQVEYLTQGPRLKEDKKTLDYTNIRTDADALLTVWYSKIGYWSPTGKPDYAPQIIMGVKLTDAHTFETIFFKAFDVASNASQVRGDNVEAIAPDEKYRYATFDALMEHFDESVQGILDGEALIAAHVAQRLKPTAAAPAASAP